jgi:hypothetical protein
MYFGHYTRLLYLSQSDDEGVFRAAERAAVRLGLAFEHRHVGRVGLAASIDSWSVAIKMAVA